MRSSEAGRRADVAESAAVAQVLAELRAHTNPSNVAGMARFGIRPATEVLGGPNMPGLRRMAKGIRRDRELSEGLWTSGVHEARILATLVAEPATFTRQDAERWVRDLDSWDVCDQFCGNLLVQVPFAYAAATDWSRREEEFVKRAGFALMAELAVHDKRAPDGAFVAFLPMIEREAVDRRNFVRKAVNWALREIGKRNASLNAAAAETAERIAAGPRGTRWVGTDAVRELRSDPVRRRVGVRPP